ncbi:hypothetical protein BDE02_02G196600 [Populus trichocarpa]|nr:hypothetical protein BDE02_02G196600 [Populus trichocarpa]
MRYVIFKIKEKKMEVVVEKTREPSESYEDFAAYLPDNDCRYAVYDFDFVTSENCPKSKIFFIACRPSSSNQPSVHHQQATTGSPVTSLHQP